MERPRVAPHLFDFQWTVSSLNSADQQRVKLPLRVSRIERLWPGLAAQWLSLHALLRQPGVCDLDPGHGPTHRSSNHVVVTSHKQNRGRLVQMLAQGQSSSSKKKIGNGCQLRASLPHTHTHTHTKSRKTLQLNPLCISYPPRHVPSTFLNQYQSLPLLCKEYFQIYMTT